MDMTKQPVDQGWICLPGRMGIGLLVSRPSKPVPLRYMPRQRGIRTRKNMRYR